MAEGNRLAEDSLDRVRGEIDEIDRALIALLARRFSCIVRASRLKTDPGTAFIGWRVEEVAALVRAEAVRVGFDADLAEEVWRFMMTRCIAFEKTHIGVRKGEITKG